MVKPPIRIGILGYGQSGRSAHALDGIQPNPEYRVTAVCDLAESNRQKAEEDFSCATYADYQQMLARESLDAVSIITRSDTHCEIACAFLQAGVHAVVTKPWALNQEEADRILEAARAGSARVFPWVPMRWSPDFRKIQSLLKEEAIGDVFAIRRYITNFFRRHDWQTELKFGGGYLLNWGMHIVQPVMDLAQSPVTRVYGRFNQVINPGDAEDNFVALLDFENGIQGTAEFTEAVEGLPWFMIQGTRGMIQSDRQTVTLIQVDPDTSGEQNRQEFSLEGKMYGDEAEIYKDLASAILENQPFGISPEEAHYGTRILDAIRQSAQSHQAVVLKPS